MHVCACATIICINSPAHPHVPPAMSLSIVSVELWVGEQIAHALHVHHDLSAARLLEGKVREGVRRVPDLLVSDEA